ncbi:hypothetical protein HKCCE3408_09810 [Rhodobacterales bacterium HKCCE3408]|nr:hypothetical protein [Rhodobacterales bacterium HKCCE3408]
MIKVVMLFLIGMALLAMFGRLRFPKIGGRQDRALPKPRRCPNCGRYNLRGGRCSDCDAGAE